ncbi:MAG: hypothetical protein HY669_03025 [Chloroflexi bacterium]|nr:hypothetical protein [Chloroflexota bacterium]
MIDPALATKVIFTLGIVNGVSLAALFLSCRCLVKLGPLAKLLKNNRFLKFYNIHCYIWIVLWLSVLTHIALGISLLGIPF